MPGDGGPAGALALCCVDEEPWLTAVRDWCRQLAARLAPVLGSLGPAPGGGGPLDDACRQPSLFDWPAAAGPRPPTRTAVALPRPAAVPGIPDVVGVSREIAEFFTQWGKDKGIELTFDAVKAIGKIALDYVLKQGP